MHRSIRLGITLLVMTAISPATRADEPATNVPLPALSVAVKQSLDRISADSLRGHLSFLSSDLLEGRGTPSKGLDLAAEYIAAQFRRAGLEPIGPDGFFQVADWKYLAPAADSVSCEWKIGDQTGRVDGSHVSGSPDHALNLPPTPAIKIDATDVKALAALDPAQVKGKVVLAQFPNPNKVERTRSREVSRARVALMQKIDDLKPALVVEIDGDTASATGLRRDLGGRRFGRTQGSAPKITLHSAQLLGAFQAMPVGPSVATLSLHAGEPKEQTTKVRNVVGLLRGSDPALKETYVVLSAHYDHLGVGWANAAGDRIYNGANDDGSGTVSVIEIASALATLHPRPKRSLVFMTFYGEEHGLVGSRHYVEHPVVPLEKTVVDINLEQVGRTDDSDGPRVSAATVTGFDYSDVASTLRIAGQAVGVDVLKHPIKSDSYFGASDNAAFARAGIPAHTISVAYMFPDYHGADDEWQKIDFVNMAKVDRMAALGVIMIADGPAPAWNKDNPRAAPYRKMRAR